MQITELGPSEVLIFDDIKDLTVGEIYQFAVRTGREDKFENPEAPDIVVGMRSQEHADSTIISVVGLSSAYVGREISPADIVSPFLKVSDFVATDIYISGVLNKIGGEIEPGCIVAGFAPAQNSSQVQDQRSIWMFMGRLRNGKPLYLCLAGRAHVKRGEVISRDLHGTLTLGMLNLRKLR